MHNIIISPFSSTVCSESKHPKNYRFIDDLMNMLRKKYNVIQIGVEGERVLQRAHRVLFNKTFQELADVAKDCVSWLSVDSFFPHMMNYYYKDTKPGLVIFTLSDPNIFGYKHNMNIVKRECLRSDQYGMWGEDLFRMDACFPPKYIFNEFNKLVESISDGTKYKQ